MYTETYSSVLSWHITVFVKMHQNPASNRHLLALHHVQGMVMGMRDAELHESISLLWEKLQVNEDALKQVLENIEGLVTM